MAGFGAGGLEVFNARGEIGCLEAVWALRVAVGLEVFGAGEGLEVFEAGKGLEVFGTEGEAGGLWSEGFLGGLGAVEGLVPPWPFFRGLADCGVFYKNQKQI